MELGVAARKHAEDPEPPAIVLVVDDEPVVLSLLVRALEQKFVRAGSRPRSATSICQE